MIIETPNLDDKIREIVNEEIQWIVEQDLSYVRDKVREIIRKETSSYHNLRDVFLNKRSVLADYVVDVTNKEILRLVSETEIKKIVLKIVLDEISKIPAYILEAMTNLLREQTTGLWSKSIANDNRVRELKKIIENKFNIYILINIDVKFKTF